MKVRVNNQTYINFDSVSIDSSIDSVASTFSIGAFFDLNNPEDREIFRPLKYNKIEIFGDSEDLLLTGTILNHEIGNKSASELINISGYSLPGVIEDCNIPYSMYPLENLKMNLAEITRRVIKPFGLNLIIDPLIEKEVNLVYPKSVCGPEETIKEYLAKLAAQRNIILSHTVKGDLLMFRPDVGAEVKYIFTDENTTSMGLSVNGQNMHNQLTVIRQPKPKKKPVLKTKTKKHKEFETDANGDIIPNLPPVVTIKTKEVKQRPKPQFFDTVNNPMIEVFRPAVQKMTAGEDLSTEAAVRDYISDELGNISFSIEINEWLDLSFGDIIEIESQSLFLRNKTKLMIDSISRSQSASGQSMRIDATLIEAFIGQEPKNIFL